MRTFRVRERIILPLFLIVFPGLGFAQQNSLDSILDSIINPIALREIVEFLASDSLRGRLTGTGEANKAADFIVNEFRNAGARPLASNQGYLMPFPTRFHNVVGYNVMAALPGTDKSSETIIYSAHYDHVGTTSNPYNLIMRSEKNSSKDSIFNGANDNASGVAALICLARYYGHLKNNSRTILFVAFAGEELGLVGSKAMAETVINPEAITCVVNLEMLGRGSAPFITGGELGNLRNLLNAELARIDPKQFKKKFFARDSNPDQFLFRRSDNFPFALLKIPAHTIIGTSDEDAYYHTVDDEARTLNYKRIQRISHAVILGMRPIVAGEISPLRINASRYSPITRFNN